MDTITDLSDYYVVKKYKHGWILGKIGTTTDEFISYEKLVEFGYIKDESNDVILSTAIVVPNSPPVKPKTKYRADNDPDWRKSKK